MARTDTSPRRVLTLAWLCLLAACKPEPVAGPPAEEEAAECYAPGKNLDRAYEEGSVGCACEDSAADCGVPEVAPDAQQEGGSTEAGGEASASAEQREGGSAEAGGEAGASSAQQETGEACGASTCTSYAYCSRSADAGMECRAKRNPGESCSQARTCMSGLCSAGSCQPQPNAQSCRGTWDCGLSIAETICRGRDCHVCVQGVNAKGEPGPWAAVEPASCPCPLPRASTVSR